MSMVSRDHCLAPTRSVDVPVDGAGGRYERLSRNCRRSRAQTNRLLALGIAGGICDGSESCDDATETVAG